MSEARADTSPITAFTPLVSLWHGSPRLTPATLWLIAANVLVFVVLLAFGAGLWHAPNEVQLAWGANFGPATKDGQWWRLTAAMFLHFGLLHLGMNMWALWDAGRLVERLYGSARFAFLYLACGITGNLVSLIAQGDRAVSGGASGAIFGVFGALLVGLLRERERVDPYEFRWLFGAVALFAAASLALGFAIPGIDNGAHLGGLVAGALLGTALGRPLGRPALPAPSRWIASAAFGLGVLLLVFNIPEPRYRLSEELQAREAIRDFLDADQRIGARWQSILQSGREEGASFDELAGRIDAGIAREYRQSSEALSALSLDPQAPSAPALEVLRRYAELRGEASHSFAEGLRAQDAEQVRAALESMRRAPELALGALQAASAAQPAALPASAPPRAAAASSAKFK